MKSDFYWKLFLSTGSPAAYGMFTRERKMEQNHVFEYEGPGTAGHSLQ